MTPDEQRAVDQAIIAGRLIDAIRLYRLATGAPLVDAKAYVEARAATLGPSEDSSAESGSTSVSWTTTTTQRASGASPAGGCLIGLIVALALAAAVFFLVKTRGFGLFSMVREPYYRSVVRSVVSNAQFERKLGAPLVVDDAGVWCNYISDSPTMRQANCQLPVHGSRSSGWVQVQVVSSAGTLHTSMWLHP